EELEPRQLLNGAGFFPQPPPPHAPAAGAGAAYVRECVPSGRFAGPGGSGQFRGDDAEAGPAQIPEGTGAAAPVPLGQGAGRTEAAGVGAGRAGPDADGSAETAPAAAASVLANPLF